MTKAECKEALKNVRAQMRLPTYGGYPANFEQFNLIYEAALFEAALKHGIDPESEGVCFYYDIEDGRGQPFPE